MLEEFTRRLDPKILKYSYEQFSKAFYIDSKKTKDRSQKQIIANIHFLK